ncbi:MAG: hypothetical protein ACRCXX_04010 [Cetobacterium sp.]|uniref:hypothetical protein n=1 Tax=Cetobacterium sp. TaxID=2071632 RepID=UPI003F3952DB
MSSSDIFTLISVILFIGALTTSKQKTITSSLFFIASAITLVPAVYNLLNEL